jgi:hypothetical protein
LIILSNYLRQHIYSYYQFHQWSSFFSRRACKINHDHSQKKKIAQLWVFPGNTLSFVCFENSQEKKVLRGLFQIIVQSFSCIDILAVEAKKQKQKQKLTVIKSTQFFEDMFDVFEKKFDSLFVVFTGPDMVTTFFWKKIPFLVCK